MFSKLPSKIKECIFVKSEHGEQKIDVTIVPKQREGGDGESGSNYTYTGNNDSMHSSSRYSLASRSRPVTGTRNNALERMRSLSKDIKDQRSRGSSLQKSQLVHGTTKADTNEDRIMVADGSRATRHVDRPLLPLGASQLAHSQHKTAHARANANSVLRQEDLATTAKEAETFREDENNAEDNKGHVQVHRLSSDRQGNNMTASFTNEDLRILEGPQDQGTRRLASNQEATSKLINPFYG